MATQWKYTDATNIVVFRILDDSSVESCLVSVLSPEDLAIGILPADPPPPIDPRDQDQLDARNDAKLAAIKDMRIAQLVNYIQNNSTTLASTRDNILVPMAKAILILWRNTF